MLLYRICKKKYAKDLSGSGSKITSGRFNSKGIAVLYTASSFPLATLEILVHVDKDLLPKNLVLVELSIPNRIIIDEIKISQLGKLWYKYPSPTYCKKIGDDWYKSHSSLALKVPSAVTRNNSDFNIVLNPSHVDFNKVKINSIKNF